MYIKDAIYKPVKLKAPLPLAEGTVLTLGGNIANEDGSDAYGIVAQRVTSLPPSGKINVAVSGTIDLTENKVTFTDNMIHGLHEFNFVPYQESTGGGSFPTPTADDNGKVLTAGADGTASWQTASGGGGGVKVVTPYVGSIPTQWNDTINYTGNVKLFAFDSAYSQTVDSGFWCVIISDEDYESVAGDSAVVVCPIEDTISEAAAILTARSSTVDTPLSSMSAVTSFTGLTGKTWIEPKTTMTPASVLLGRYISSDGLSVGSLLIVRKSDIMYDELSS